MVQLDTRKYTAGLWPINFKMTCGCDDCRLRAGGAPAAGSGRLLPSAWFAVDDKETGGEVPKWSQRARLESGLGPNQPHVGSNPTLSAIFPAEIRPVRVIR